MRAFVRGVIRRETSVTSRIEADGADMGEDRGSSHPRHATARGKEGEGRDDDFIAGPNAQGHESQENGVGAEEISQGMGNAEFRSRLGLEAFEFRPHDIMTAAEDPNEGLRQFGFQGQVLRFEIEKWNSHRSVR